MTTAAEVAAKKAIRRMEDERRRAGMGLRAKDYDISSCLICRQPLIRPAGHSRAILCGDCGPRKMTDPYVRKALGH